MTDSHESSTSPSASSSDEANISLQRPVQWDESLLSRKPVVEPPAHVISCVDPVTREPLGEVPVNSAKEVSERVAEARRAQHAWHTAPASERRKVLRYILDHILEYADELCEIIVHTTGKTREDAIGSELWAACEMLHGTLNHGEIQLSRKRNLLGIALPNKRTSKAKNPGVIGVVAPWNDPLLGILGAVIPAIWAGNAVVLKVSEKVAWSAARIQRLFDEALTHHGYPIELVTLLTGDAETEAALCSAGVDKLMFPESTPHRRNAKGSGMGNHQDAVGQFGAKNLSTLRAFSTSSYGILGLGRSYDTIKATLRLIYSDGARNKWGALRDLIRGVGAG